MVLFTLFASLVANQAHPTPKGIKGRGDKPWAREGRENTKGLSLQWCIMQLFERRDEKERVSILSVGWLVGWNGWGQTPSCWNSVEETRSRTTLSIINKLFLIFSLSLLRISLTTTPCRHWFFPLPRTKWQAPPILFIASRIPLSLRMPHESREFWRKQQTYTHTRTHASIRFSIRSFPPSGLYCTEKPAFMPTLFSCFLFVLLQRPPFKEKIKANCITTNGSCVSLSFVRVLVSVHYTHSHLSCLPLRKKLLHACMIFIWNGKGEGKEARGKLGHGEGRLRISVHVGINFLTPFFFLLFSLLSDTNF